MEMDFSLDPARAEALIAAQGLPATVKTVDRLARVHGMEAAAWAVGQVTLRERAGTKFSAPERMIFTKDGLEMTSHETVSEFHASLFSHKQRVIDGTCGLGGDLIALAERGEAEGCDLSREALCCAQWNLKERGLTARVTQGSCLDLDWRGRSLWLDPARRGGSGRTLNPDSFSPSLAAILSKAEEAEEVWIKLTPLLSDSLLESGGQGVVFVSHKGECVEALMQGGRGEGTRSRRAFLVDEGLWLEASPIPSQASGPGPWVYEADPAAIRGHCLGGFGLESMGDTPGWLTGKEMEPSPWLTSFRVVWSGAWREPVVQGFLADEGIWLDAVKTRGVKAEPSELLKRLRKGAHQKGSPRRELMLYCQGPKIKALLVERIREQPWG